MTANVTAWSSFLAELEDPALKFAQADAILLQETRLEPHQLTTARRQARRLGWTFDATACEHGPNGGAAGGVGVLVRQHLGLRRLDLGHEETHVPFSARLGFWVTSGGGPCGSILGAAYLYDGVEDGDQNMDLLYLLGGVLRATSKPYVIGADWQMEPPTLEATGWRQGLQGHVRRAHRPTCFMAKSAREIDFFLVHPRFCAGDVSVLDEVGLRPHKALLLQVQGSKGPVPKLTVLRKPKPFPVDRMWGPLQCPDPCWDRERAAAMAASSQQELDAAGDQWLEGYERELVNHFDLHDDMQLYCGRTAKGPRTRQVPAEQQVRGDARVPAGERHWGWLADRVLEWQHLRASPHAAARAHAQSLLLRLRKFRPPAVRTCDPRWRVWRQEVRHLPSRTSPELDGLREHLRRYDSKATADAARRRYRGWCDWARKAVTEDGGRRAYGWIREAAPWRQATTADQQGVNTLQQDAERHAAPWHHLWSDASGGPIPAWPSSMEAVALPSVDELVTAAHAFPRRTALGVDSVHPRHLLVLCEAAVAALIALWEAMLRVGAVPTRLAMLLVILLPRPDGGVRPIGLFPGTLRPLTRWTRLTAGSIWSHAQGRPYIFGVAGASCEVCVWQQAAAAEYASCQNLCAASVLFDLSKAYEHIGFRLLAQRAAQFGFPLRLLRVLLALYQMPRLVSLERATAMPYAPQRGVAAGCSFADLMMRLVILGALDPVHAKWPHCRLANVVDDTQLQFIGERGRVVRDTVAATLALHAEFETGAALKVNSDKFALLSNDAAAAASIAQRVPFLRKAVATSTRNLGVDYACGAKRSAAKVRLRRQQKVKKLVLKIKALRRAGARVRRLVSGSLVPSGVWGGGVSAAAWHHVQRLRAAAHCALFARQTGRSATLDLGLAAGGRHVMEVDPAYKATMDPITMLHSSLWEDWLPRGWIVRTMQEAVRTQLDSAHPWRTLRGPISGAVACCGRIGWEFEHGKPATQLRLRDGALVDLLEQCPATLRQVARRDTEAWLLDRAVDQHPFMGDLSHRPFLLPLQRLCQRSPTKDWSAQHQGMLKAIVTNGIWSQQRAYTAGISEEHACPACQGEGSLWHIFWDCPASATFRDDYGLLETVKKGARERSQWSLWTHALLPDPRIWLPPPQRELQITWDKAPPDGYLAGDIYGDGSAHHVHDERRRRAGWGLVMVEKRRGGCEVVELAVAFGPLPGLEQVTPAAEAMALLVFLMHAGPPPHRFHTDCQWVYDSFKAGEQATTGSSCVHADLWRAIWRHLRDLGPDAVELRKVKAHASEADVTAGRVRADDRLGNSLADAAARRGAAQHPVDAAADQRVDRTELLVQSVAKFLARLLTAPCGQLALRPLTSQRRRRGAPRLRKKLEATRRGHLLTLHHGRMRCLHCLRSSRGPTYFARRRCHPAGAPQGRAHRLWTADGATFCSACGGTSATKAKLLVQRCRGRPTKWGKRVLAKMWAAGPSPLGQAAFDQAYADMAGASGPLEDV